MLSDGVIDTAKYASLLQKYTETGVASVSFTQDEIKELEDTFEEEMENIDMEEPEDKGVMKELNLKENNV